MIIDQLNSELTGGAGVAARRLHEALLGFGIESRLWCKRLAPEFSAPGISRLSFESPRSSLADRWKRWQQYVARKLQWRIDKWRYLHGRSAAFEMFSVPWLDHDTPFDRNVLRGDVLHLHWVTKFLDLPSFFASVPDDHPVVWTLHDMCPFTGGCHHADGCQAYSSACGHCPQLVRPRAGDLSQRVLAAKRAAIKGKNLHIITPSRWMERLVRQSRVFAGCDVATIYNGLDVRQFVPHDKQAARQKLGLPPNGWLVAFGAAWLPNRRKGIVEYVAALSKLAQQSQVMGLIFGDGDFPRDAVPAFPYRRVGFLSSASQQSLVYSAADVFVLSSLGENLAQTGVESLSCGTPVVAFDVGGLSEYVRSGETGMLARLGDVDDLARQISWLLEQPDLRRQMAFRGRQFVEREFDHCRQAQKYVELYQRLLDDKVSISDRTAKVA